jgi:hypothetical protein
MISILNTSNAKTRDEAFHLIIEKMSHSMQYIRLAYKFEHSYCSCCSYEYFHILCKVLNNYRILSYDAYYFS